MSEFTTAWLHERENRLNRKVRHPESQRDQAPALGGAVPGKTERLPKTVVRFIGYRVTLLDPDNFAGSVKDLLDGLRHAGLLPGDRPDQITLITEQEKVDVYSEEKTVIEIEPCKH